MALLLANWKSNKSLPEASSWIERVHQAGIDNLHEVIVAVPFPFVFPLSEQLAKLDSKLSLATQSLSSFPQGAYTGEVHPTQILGSRATYSILGHSERRRYQHETVQDVLNKIEFAIEAGITPVVCVDKDTFHHQLDGISKDMLDRMVVAYEPIESIGTGVAEELGTTLEVVTQIHTLTSPTLRVLYGGSVSAENISRYTKQTPMAGVLVGSASLDASSWIDLCRAA